MIRRTKVVSTLGPASWDEPVLKQLIAAGVDVVRLNFSHGDHEGHGRTYERVRRLAAEADRHIAVLQDLGGPKLRTGRVQGEEPIELVEGELVTLVAESEEATAERIGVNHDAVVTATDVGQRIFINDGLLELRVEEMGEGEVRCRIVRGGPLSSRKGVNLPGSALTGVPAVTEKDWADLEWGIANGVDYVALSFVRSPEEVRQVKARLRQAGSKAGVIAKIEKPQALAVIDEIIEAADGIMIARGDLGVELDPQQVPLVQKNLIRKCNEAERPVITATQMLESMQTNARPTRAEVSDVANAIFDGSDAVMLSGETATGEHPVAALRMMAEIALAADGFITEDQDYCGRNSFLRPDSMGEAFGRATELMVRELDIAAIFVADVDGERTVAVSKARPQARVLAMASDPAVLRRMALFWGVDPLLLPQVERGSQLLRITEEMAVDRGLVSEGEWLALLAGSPHDRPGPINALRVHQVGDEG